MQITQEISDLFRIVRTKLGGGVREIQLDDNQLCDLLEVAIGDYSEKVLNWIIMSNWLSYYGQKNINFMTAQDIAYGLTTKMLDFSKDFSYWFSRDVGLQQRGNFELKKDYITVEKGKQCYLIPKGREINKVLYVTPSTTKAALYGSNFGIDTGIGGGYAQVGNFSGVGFPSFYVGSAYDTLLLASDLKLKNSLFRGDLCYKVTAGPDGTHILHLLSTPGSPNAFGSLAVDDTWGWNNYVNCYVWYTYYDVGENTDDIDACRLENKDDILLTPDQVPLKKLRYEFMNEPTQQIIRQLLVAEAMITLGLIRGTFSGKVMIPDAELQMDYAMFLDLGKQEKQNAMDNLIQRLEAMLPWNMMKNMSEMTDSLMNILNKKPLGMYWI